MQATVTHKVTIHASAKEVFRYLSDPRKHTLWNPHLQSVSTVKPLKLGSTYISTNFLLGVTIEMNNIVTNFIKNSLIEISGGSGTLQSCVEYRLAEEAGATHITCHTTVSSTVRAFMYTRPVFKLLAQREIRADLRALKIVVEQKLD